MQYIPRRTDGTISVERLVNLLEDDNFETNIRTVQRDLLDLEENYYPKLKCIKGKPNKWYWDRDEMVTIPAMGQFSALAFLLAEKMLTPLLPSQSLSYLQPNFNTARHTLDDINKRRTRNWLKKVRVVPRSMRMINAPIRSGILDVVSQALYEDKQIQMTYLSASSKARNSGKEKTKEPYNVHPYALIHRETTTELIGRIAHDTKIRRFLLHRIQSATIYTEKSVIPDDFDLDKFIQNEMAKPLSGQLITLKLWISKDGYGQAHVLETRLSNDQEIEETDDGLIVTASVHESIELKWWLLGMGERIKVLSPASLRDNIKTTLKSASELYE
jgi:predicted DNA-binding transcriptional regulator YafY